MSRQQLLNPQPGAFLCHSVPIDMAEAEFPERELSIGNAKELAAVA